MQNRHIKSHKQSIHKESQDMCDQCNKKETKKRNLKIHIKKFMKPECDQCKYKATQNDHFKLHISYESNFQHLVYKFQLKFFSSPT